jgi:TonB family protein
MRARILLPLASLLFACAMSLAQNFPTLGSNPQNQAKDQDKDKNNKDKNKDTQTRAQALLNKARQLSDIRAPDAPPFRLKATFSFTGPALEIVHGTYTEVWASNSQWRRETVVNHSSRVEIGGKNRIWQLDNSNDFPEPAARISSLLDLLPSSSAAAEFESISDDPDGDPPAQCALTKPDSSHHKSVFCFDKKTGLLVGQAFPETRPRNVVQDSCDYVKFRKLGNDWFPVEMACFADRHHTLDVSVLELVIEPSPNPDLFTVPANAIELGNCSTKSGPPRATSSPYPQRPVGSRDEEAIVTLSLIVDAKGKPQNVKVVNSGGPRFDDAALTAVRSWRFKPSTCNGEPMPMQINMKIDFPELYRVWDR